MRIMVLGATGMLGHKLVQVLGQHFEVYAGVRGNGELLVASGICDRNRIVGGLEACDYHTIEKALQNTKPDVVVNAIGVIKQREESKNARISIEINSLFPHRLAESLSVLGGRLITFSTDCVFRGDRGSYVEEDPTDARDVYGRSKVLGEVKDRGRLTLRTSIIGRELQSSRSIVEWMISQRGGNVKGFVNAIFTGLTTLEISRILRMVISKQPELDGIFHISSEPISKFDLIRLINDEMRLGISIERDEIVEIDRSLNSDKFRSQTGYRPPEWRSMVKEMVEDAHNYEEWRQLRF